MKRDYSWMVVTVGALAMMFGPWLALGQNAPLDEPPALAATLAPASGEAPSTDGTVRVRIPAETLVKGALYTLGDIAQIEGASSDLRERLQALQAGHSPMPGRVLPINRTALTALVTSLAGSTPVSVEIPERAQVKREAQVVAAAELGRLVLGRAQRDAQGENGNLAPENLQQELSSPLSDLTLPVGEVNWEINPLGTSLSAGGERSYQVSARVEGETAWRGSVRIRQRVYQMVVMARGALPRGKVLSAEDLTQERVEVTRRNNKGFMTHPAQAVGQKTIRLIAANEPLTQDMLERPLAIREGEKVLLVYQTPHVVLSVPGVAMNGAMVGDFLPARNLDSGKVVYGTLQADHSVKVN